MKWCANCQRHAKRGYRVGHCAGDTCNRCPWPGCPCTHDGGCDRGYIEETPDDVSSMAQVRKCGTCRDWAEALEMNPPEPNWRAVS